MKISHAFAIAAALAVIFLFGSWYGHRGPVHSPDSGRLALYYIDPMNPAHTSDKPGLAPCGMKLEPVYAEGTSGDHAMVKSGSMMPLGTAKISQEKQQLIGVRVDKVERRSVSYDLRIPGRVATDENRIFRLLGWTDGWTLEIKDTATTGSIVEKDQLLATYYSREFLNAQQAYVYALNTLDRFKNENESDQQLELTKGKVRSTEENLVALGMSAAQLREVARTREITKYIELRAPVKGFVVARNIFPALRFDRGTEFFRIADLSRIWVLADIFENEGKFIHPGMHAQVTHLQLGKSYDAVVSETPPKFDPVTRTFKVRLEMDNPELEFREDMFVDVEFPVTLPPALTVPVDAVVDSGLTKTVFVDRGNGFFEPRQVETGFQAGRRVQINQGLSEGERIVVSGNFLIDSESRMKLAAAGLNGKLSKDPVCGMMLDENKAKVAGLMSEHQGRSYYFCSQECKKEFDTNRAAYLKTTDSKASWAKVPSAPHEAPQQ